MNKKQKIRAIAAAAFVWLAAGTLLIYSGNSVAFAAIIGGFAAIPLTSEIARQALRNAPAKRLAFFLDAVWLAVFIYALVEMFSITSSEVVLTSMILSLAFAKWKETSARINATKSANDATRGDL